MISVAPSFYGGEWPLSARTLSNHRSQKLLIYSNDLLPIPWQDRRLLSTLNQPPNQQKTPRSPAFRKGAQAPRQQSGFGEPSFQDINHGALSSSERGILEEQPSRAKATGTSQQAPNRQSTCSKHSPRHQ